MNTNYIDEIVENNKTITSRLLHGMVVEKFPGCTISSTTAKRAHQAVGWTAKKTRYCTLISDINKKKSLDPWCLDRVVEKDMDLEDVIWTDESIVQLEPHRKTIYLKQGQPVLGQDTLLKSTSGEGSLQGVLQQLS